MRSTSRGPRRRGPRALVTSLLAAPLIAACEVPFEPYVDNVDHPFSLFGYLDVDAVIQWVRVTPVRQNLVSGPAPIDAVVTLEDVTTGRVVTLTEQVRGFEDPELGSTGYAHNFWTLEPILPGRTYRISVARSDGATTTALVETPSEVSVTTTYFEGPPDVPKDGEPDPFREPLRVTARGDVLLYHHLTYTLWDRSEAAPSFTTRLPPPISTTNRVYDFAFPRDSLRIFSFIDLRKMESSIGIAASGWPFHGEVAHQDQAIPGVVPSNVENGFGYVGGVAIVRVPFARCNPVEPRADGLPVCTLVIDEESTTVAGRLIGACGPPYPRPSVRLTRRDAAGGVAVFEAKMTFGGQYEIRGIEPGADLLLEVPDGPVGGFVVPSLAPGTRWVAPNVTAGLDCEARASPTP